MVYFFFFVWFFIEFNLNDVILLCLGNMLVFLICILVYLNLFDDEKNDIEVYVRK